MPRVVMPMRAQLEQKIRWRDAVKIATTAASGS
jgi:hypothetical protein